MTPMTSSPSSPGASLQLDFLIVGGGIAGLAAAYILAKGGHKVRVLEKSPSLDLPASGIRVPPNLSKVLREWIGEEKLASLTSLNQGTPLYDLLTSRRKGYNPWKPVVMRETGGDFLLMHRADAHKVLYDLAISAGVRVDFSVNVASVEPGEPRPRITLATGQSFTADIVIGADGPCSTVRRTAFELENDLEPTGMVVYSGTISAQKLLKDPVLASFVQADEWPIFMGTNRSVCCHPVRGRKELAVQLFWPDEGRPKGQDPHGPWQNVVATSELRLDDCGDIVKRMVKLIPFFVKTPWMKRKSPLEDWVDDSGRIVLMGEAAHPWLPGGTHSSSMAVEDAVVFGTLFSHLAQGDQIPIFLHAYHELREARNKTVKDKDVESFEVMWLPPGPARDARDANTPSEDEDVDEGMLKEQFDALLEIFGYNAADAAQEWWMDWGRLSQARESKARYRLVDYMKK